MRTRSRSIVQSSASYAAFAQGNFTNHSNDRSPKEWTQASGYTHPAAAGVLSGFDEVMRDEVGQYPKVGQVDHYRCSVEAESLAGNYLTGGTGSTSYKGYYWYSDPVGSKLNTLESASCVDAIRGYCDGDPSHEHPDWTVNWAQQDDSKIIQQMYDQARRPVVQGLQNLAEANEIPDSLKGFIKYAPLKARAWEPMRKFVKRASKKAAGNFLAYSFCIAPLISDIEKARRYLKRVEADYRRFVSCPVRRISRVFNGTAVFSKDPSVMTSRTKWYQGLALQVPVTRYVMTYRERCPYTTEFFRKLSYLINRFGAAGPASFAWEMVPFSFVVDWFIDTSSVVGFLDDKLNSDRLEVLNLSISRKYELETDVFRDVWDGSVNALVESRKRGSVVYRRYMRSELAKAYSIDFSERFGKKQMLLSVALLRQMFK